MNGSSPHGPFIVVGAPIYLSSAGLRRVLRVVFGSAALAVSVGFCSAFIRFQGHIAAAAAKGFAPPSVVLSLLLAC